MAFQELKWNGLEEINLFLRPKATAMFSVTGVDSDRLAIDGVAKYKTIEVVN